MVVHNFLKIGNQRNSKRKVQKCQDCFPTKNHGCTILNKIYLKSMYFNSDMLLSVREGGKLKTIFISHTICLNIG